MKLRPESFEHDTSKPNNMLIKVIMLYSFVAVQFMKQQVEYLREDGKTKTDPNGMLTIVESDSNLKRPSSSGHRNGNSKIFYS